MMCRQAWKRRLRIPFLFRPSAKLRGREFRDAGIATSVGSTNSRPFRPLVGLLLAALLSTSAQADTRQDEGLWLMVAGQGPLSINQEQPGPFRWWLDLQPRFTSEANGLAQALVRPGVGYAFGGRAAGWLGYAWILTDIRGGGYSEEHRIWQQFTWSTRIKKLKLASRTRLEQRFLDTGDDVGWRARQFVKATLPVMVLPRFYLSAYDEIFIDLNDTDWGQDPGLSQNRLFAGIGWKPALPPNTGPISVEVGYLNQYLNRASGPDKINHILSLNLFLKF